MRIKFTSSILIPTNLTKFNETIDEMLSITGYSNDGYDKEDLSFTWKYSNMTHITLDI